MPTFKEQGYDLEGSGWYAVFAPAGTSKDIVDRTSRLVAEATQSAEARAWILKGGMEPTGTTPAELAAILKADYERWGPVDQGIGLQLRGPDRRSMISQGPGRGTARARAAMTGCSLSEAHVLVLDRQAVDAAIGRRDPRRHLARLDAPRCIRLTARSLIALASESSPAVPAA